tara:strand:+ start:527 stop:1216 length:690 start_codon:yes stop_codon:yes gene_type:complete
MNKKRYLALNGLAQPTGDIKYSFDFGQFSQDYCVNMVLDIDNGFFLDIGAGVSSLDPKSVLISTMSNTYGLERFREWDGIAIDYDEIYIEEAKRFRSCTLVCEDLTKTNINDILESHNAPKKMDYLSFDVDDAQERVFSDMDFSTYSFRMITFEHNRHLCSEDSRWQELYESSRDKFQSLGYKVLFGNVGLYPNQPVEDWYVDQETFDKYESISSENLTTSQIRNVLQR